MNTSRSLLTPIQIILSLAGITLVRTFLENFSNPEPLAGFTSLLLMVNYFLFYGALVLTFGIIIGVATKQPFLKTTSLAVRGLPIIWIAPIIDLLLTRGACMAYLSNPGMGLIWDFLTIGGPFGICGATIGIRIEIIIVIIAIIRYTYKKTGFWGRSLAAGLATYTALFIQSALPGIMLTILGKSTPKELLDYFSGSLLGSIHTIGAGEGAPRIIEQIAIVMGRIPWMIIVLSLVVFFVYQYRATITPWIKNARLTRIAYYTFLGIAGAVFALKTTLGATPIASFGASLTELDILAFIILMISTWCSGWLAGIINDYADRELDEKSDQYRPVAAQTISTQELLQGGAILGTIALTGGLMISWNVTMMLVTAQVAYALYSLNPFRYKKHFFSSSFFVATAGLATFLSGYFVISSNQQFVALPYGTLFAIWITLGIISNTKDFKDVATDREHGITTLPVRYGSRKAGKILSYTLMGWLIVLGIVTSSWWIALQAVPWIIIDLVLKKRIPEYVRFMIVFAQIILLIIVL